jgi:hypothetical protein
VYVFGKLLPKTLKSESLVRQISVYEVDLLMLLGPRYESSSPELMIFFFLLALDLRDI